MASVEHALRADSDCDAELIAELTTSIRLSLSTASSSLLTHQAYLASAITSNLTKKAIDSLQPLLGVTATYHYSIPFENVRRHWCCGVRLESQQFKASLSRPLDID